MVLKRKFNQSFCYIEPFCGSLEPSWSLHRQRKTHDQRECTRRDASGGESLVTTKAKYAHVMKTFDAKKVSFCHF